MHARDFFEKQLDLALQAFLRSAGGFSREPCRRRVLGAVRRDLDVPAWRERPDEARQAAELFVVLQAVEDFEDREIGFAAGEPLGAAAAPEAKRLAAIFQESQERFPQGRL